MLLEGKKALIFGVANKRSIAWAIAQRLHDEGARVGFTYQGERLQEKVASLVAGLGGANPLYPCDVTNQEEVNQVFESVKKDFGGLDILVHCVAFAPKDELEGRLIDTTRDGYLLSHEISAYSLLRLAHAAEPMMNPGGSIVALTYLGSEKVVPHYNVMGMAKASLESGIRYLASELGEKNIRVNGVSAGPVNTLAARGISGFTSMLEHHRTKAPLKRNVELEEVANTALFLASPMSSGITGEVLYCDCGYRVMGM